MKTKKIRYISNLLAIESQNLSFNMEDDQWQTVLDRVKMAIGDADMWRFMVLHGSAFVEHHTGVVAQGIMGGLDWWFMDEQTGKAVDISDIAANDGKPCAMPIINVCVSFNQSNGLHDIDIVFKDQESTFLIEIKTSDVIGVTTIH